MKRIFAGMVAGVAIGVWFPATARDLAPISMVFLRLIRSILAPLIFATLVYGIAGSGDLKKMGRIGLKSIVYFEVITTIALFIGLAAVNFLRPGVGRTLAASATAPAMPAQTLNTVLEHIFPASIIDAMARNDVLQVVVFSFLFGAACLAIGAKAGPVVAFCGSLAEVMFRYTNYVMWLAPLGAGAALAVTIGTNGLGVLFGLGKLLATLYLALIISVIGIFGAVIAVFRIPLQRFIAAVRAPTLIAFSTASSEAALPLALENMESFGVPAHIAGFVMPTGYSFNLFGTTLYLSVASVFVAQAAGIPLTFGQQLLMMLTLMLSSKGVAGIPRSAIVVLSGTLATFHLPMEGVAVLLGVDALMDMGRTAVNVLGNCLACAVVAKSES
ncbi:dicarboxylate/amino acid:cation symporter [Nevskia soli]|uniref:dicarboxylate/amino acid:cation symporter n=1 Tax=Nevskia soli TaxID=418856 RepID=UPI001C5C9712|nr:cation:dicarboxylase symporter family transporter [Nevskia soli]